MNVDTLTQLRDHIVALLPGRFDMSRWSALRGQPIEPAALIHDCNTCGCIGGWAQALKLNLGLSDEQKDHLFYPADFEDILYEDVTQLDAVLVLDKLITTGEIDWSHVRERR